MNVFKNVKVIIFLVVLILGAIILAVKGIDYGLDFKGGTQFILTLDKEVDASTMDKMQSTIAQRLDWTGLQDVKVTSWDSKYIGVQIAESDPEKIAQLEELLQKQGRFECIFKEKILFTGDDVITVSKSAEGGYGIFKHENYYSWRLPFNLSAKGARDFSEGIWKSCVILPDGSANCPSTYFYIDRPMNSIVLIPQDVYDNEKYTNNNIKLEDIFSVASVNYKVYSELNEEFINSLKKEIKDKNITNILVNAEYDYSILNDSNLNVKIISKEKSENYPWVWSATGLKTIIGLNKDITNVNATSVDSSNFQVYLNLIIEGSAVELTDAQNELNELYAILNSGSLPVGIDNISKETVSPILGKNILNKILIVGIISLLVVALVIFLRYKDPKIFLPIFFVGTSEVFLTIAFASLINWQLDLGAIAGILAAVGTGVDDQIIITDELEKNKKEEKEEGSLLSKIKRAFFIVWMSAATLAVTMLPIVFVFGGVPKLVGFAITTLAGAAIGVFITRPAYAVFIKHLLQK